ncbi:phospho-sugar mutase [Gordonia sp. TBRC 11910]|uniref:Phospho-sugar mutase n=1 Tax=Gordonia asplenii TaxID=2725283 RepID=A0A848KXX1_9ACTN|nr:phospho-sugar mutase [Gordonia asplenii]NMO01061.1 phospho-sugar mutase [Gordonia asplenii]
MTSSPLSEAARAWIDDDPDPVSRAQLGALLDDPSRCDDLAERFSDTLHFGTAGLRGVVRAGPNGMNVATVTRATAAVGAWLTAHENIGGTVVVGRDARHGSAAFFTATTEVLAALGFDVVALPGVAPTPLVAFATRRLDAVAGIQITASHNPAADNGYKLYGRGGRQIVSPDDAEIEALMRDVGPTKDIGRVTVSVDARAAAVRDDYLARIAELPTGSPATPLRIALTAMHGVGGTLAVDALCRAGFDDVRVVATQFEPDPDFPTVGFPNPEEPGATDLLLETAIRTGSDVAIALDPDADRMAVGIPTASGWRMLTGDETGGLLCAYLLRHAPAGPKTVASSIVSGMLAAATAESAGATSVRTLTGFKWLSRADDDCPDAPLRYAYEEAIGHCVDPAAVRDKDGISAAVVMSSIARQCKSDGETIVGLLDDLYRAHGVHHTAATSRRLTTPAEFDAVMTSLRRDPPSSIAGIDVDIEDFASRGDGLRTDAIALTGTSDDGARLRVMVRPSGTEPKIKYYVETIVGLGRYGHTQTLEEHKQRAARLADAALADLIR